MDFSYRVLAKAAALKARWPASVHTLLANHELSQIVGAGVMKDGVNLVAAFNEALDYAFGGDAERVRAAVEAFIRSMPLALVAGDPPEANSPPTRLLFAHSLPPPELMDRFDPGVLGRALTADDYTPRRGSAHLMIWGRGHTPEHLEHLANLWGVRLFILGHEKAERGWLSVPPNAVVLNSDHERGVVLPIDLGNPPAPPADETWGLVPLSDRALDG
jgi:hypothetical protein